MTKEQAIEWLKSLNYCDGEETQEVAQAIDMAIKTLEQEPSDDCVNRQAVLDTLMKYEKPCDDRQDFYLDSTTEFEEEIKALPPVTPTRKAPREDITEDEVKINMLELAFNQVKEQAEGIEVSTDKYRLIFKAEKRGNTKRKGEPIEGNNESYNCENWIP